MSEKETAYARKAYGQKLVELGKKNKDIVVLDADLSKSTKTMLFGKEFPDRFFEMGIAEANMVSTAAGLASCGKIPFVSTFAVFATGRVYDQIRMDVAYSESNVKIFATHGGISVGKDGASHQMIEDLSLMRVLPNMTVMAPSDSVQTSRLVEIMAETKGPMYARVGRPPAPIIYDEEDVEDLKIGKGVVLNEGSDVCFIACGTMVEPALMAAEELKEKDVEASVLDIHTLKPLDEKLISKHAEKANVVITAEEHSIMGGLGSAVSETLVEQGICNKFHRVGIRDVFCESGSPADLLEKYNLNKEHLVKKALEIL
ncbi:MAG: transketolase family protein [Candidatus Thermoplasmatota archaeon]